MKLILVVVFLAISIVSAAYVPYPGDYKKGGSKPHKPHNHHYHHPGHRPNKHKHSMHRRDVGTIISSNVHAEATQVNPVIMPQVLSNIDEISQQAMQHIPQVMNYIIGQQKHDKHKVPVTDTVVPVVTPVKIPVVSHHHEHVTSTHKPHYHPDHSNKGQTIVEYKSGVDEGVHLENVVLPIVPTPMSSSIVTPIIVPMTDTVPMPLSMIVSESGTSVEVLPVVKPAMTVTPISTVHKEEQKLEELENSKIEGLIHIVEDDQVGVHPVHVVHPVQPVQPVPSVQIPHVVVEVPSVEVTVPNHHEPKDTEQFHQVHQVEKNPEVPYVVEHPVGKPKPHSPVHHHVHVDNTVSSVNKPNVPSVPVVEKVPDINDNVPIVEVAVQKIEIEPRKEEGTKNVQDVSVSHHVIKPHKPHNPEDIEIVTTPVVPSHHHKTD